MNKHLAKVFFVLFFISVSACSTVSTPPSNVPTVAEAEVPASSNPSGDMEQASNKTDQNTLQTIDVSNVSTKDPLIGGNLEKAMDVNDRTKLSKALDKSPGKRTEWTNKNTGITFLVIPIKKVVIENNPFCREYTVTATRNEKENQINGTACIASDGNWHTL